MVMRRAISSSIYSQCITFIASHLHVAGRKEQQNNLQLSFILSDACGLQLVDSHLTRLTHPLLGSSCNTCVVVFAGPRSMAKIHLVKPPLFERQSVFPTPWIAAGHYHALPWGPLGSFPTLPIIWCHF